MEYIAGPIHGFYIACYTVPTREGHYGYAKICALCPESVWDPGIATRKVGKGPYATEEQAIVAVQTEARRRLAARRVHAAALAGQTAQ